MEGAATASASPGQPAAAAPPAAVQNHVPAPSTVPPVATAAGSVGGPAETLLEGAIETLRQLSIIVEDYHPHQPPTFLYDKINGLIDNLSQIDRARHQHDGVEVPMQIFQFIDEGKNPDLYVQDSLLRRCLDRNEKTRGKMHLLQRLKEEIAQGAAELLDGEQEDHLAKMVTDVDPPDQGQGQQ